MNESVKKRIQETKEFISKYKINFGNKESACEIYKERINEYLKYNDHRPFCEIDLARYKVISDSQKNLDEDPDAIILKVLITKDGMELL